MSLSLIGFLTTTVGELVIGYSVLRVHSSLEREKQVDEKVLTEVKKEKGVTLIGMILIVLGFALQLVSERFF